MGDGLMSQYLFFGEDFQLVFHDIVIHLDKILFFRYI